VPAFLFDDLRVEEASLDGLDGTLIESIAERYRRTPVTLFSQWIGKHRTRKKS
jgi:hypothetical protein